MSRDAWPQLARLPVALPVAFVLAGCGGANGPPEPSRPSVATTIPAGSVPRGAGDLRAALRPPGPAVTPALLAQGERAYAGKCAACHGRALDGDGPVVRAGFPSPGRLDPDALVADDVVVVITDGRGEMPSLAAQVPPLERWAIARWLERR